MIDSISIKNFQSHKDTVLNFEPGITVILGPTDVGKSSVYRALTWTALNKRVRSLETHDTKRTEVSIDGVSRIKTTSENMYKVGDEIYKAVRSEVPTQVEESLRLSSLNFQGQHEAYFLVSDSSGQVSRTLNEVADLQNIDKARKEVRARVKSTKEEKDRLQELMEEQKRKVEDSSWVREADTDYKVIEKLEVEVETLQKTENSVKEKVFAYEKQLSELNEIPKTVVDSKAIDRLITALHVDKTLEKIVAKVEANEVTFPDPREDIEHIERLQKIDCETPIWESILIRAEEASTELKNYPEEIVDCSSIVVELQSATDNFNTLSSIIGDVKLLSGSLSEAEDELTEGTVFYNKKLKEMGKCPLCEGNL